MHYVKLISSHSRYYRLLCARHTVPHRICRLSHSFSGDVTDRERKDNMSVYQKLKDRCILYGTFPDTVIKQLDTLVSKQLSCIYAGFDPTADSLHIGNLLVLIALLHFYAAGFDVIAVIGGATAQLGDPSGKQEDREAVPVDVIQRNSHALNVQLNTIFSNFTDHIHKGKRDLLKPIRVINNIHLYEKTNVIKFLGDVGRRFRLRHMLGKQMVKSRLEAEAGLTFSEFSYQVFQAYDWLQLCEKFNCCLQIGGVDQLGNIHAGHDLIASMLNKEAFGLLVPLITNEVGDKIGKTKGATLWLDRNKTSPFNIYQYFLRLHDIEVKKYMQLYTFYEENQVNEICAKHLREPETRWGQEKLAKAITLLLHGPEGLQIAQKCSTALYSSSPEDLAKLSAEEILQALQGVPLLDMKFVSGLSIRNLLLQIGCFPTAKHAENTVCNGGIYINHIQVKEPEAVVIPGTHILPSNITLLRVGKKHHYLIRWGEGNSVGDQLAMQ